MTEVTFKVPNISCQHCIHTIQTELSDLAGVKAVEAKLETKEVTVAFEPPATQAKLEAALADIEYPVAKA